MSFTEMSKSRAIIYDLLAAAFYAVNVPVSKLLLSQVGPTMMASLLYLGAGIGMAGLSLADKSEKGEKLTWIYLVALAIMAAGATVAAADTLIRSHEHEHQHTYTHFHDGHMHTHTIVHSHVYDHYAAETRHGHHHSAEELGKLHNSHQ